MRIFFLLPESIKVRLNLPVKDKDRFDQSDFDKLVLVGLFLGMLAGLAVLGLPNFLQLNLLLVLVSIIILTEVIFYLKKDKPTKKNKFILVYFS